MRWGVLFVVFLIFAPATVYADSDPVKLCQDVVLAALNGEGNRAAELAGAAYSGSDKQQKTAQYAHNLDQLYTAFKAIDGPVKFIDAAETRRIGKSISIVFVLVSKGPIPLYISCRSENYGAGWVNVNFSANTDFTKIVL